MKSRNFVLLVSVFIFLFSIANASAKYSGGTGEPNDPYKITSAQNLIDLGNSEDSDKHFILEANIDLTEYTFNQAVIPDFEGVFDGNNHTISSLKIEDTGNLGLFGVLYEDAEVSNLILEEIDINGTGNYVGGIAGKNYGSIISCSSTGNVSGLDNVGGLIGKNYGFISQCYSKSTINGRNYSGGLVGGNRVTITSSYSMGTVNGESFVGGLTGGNYNIGNITSSYSTSQVNGNSYTGGLIGFNGNPKTGYGTITSSFWDTQTSELSTSDGGTGLTTAEMQDMNTFLTEGWDFIGETDNGTEDIWWIDNGLDYPRLWWELEQTPQKYSGGTGEPNDPYIITTAQDLIDLGNEPNDYDKHFIQDANIDLTEYIFEGAVIAWDTNSDDSTFSGNSFKGTFDGQGYEIINLHIEGQDYLGMFGCIGPDAIITNIGLENTDINSVGDYIGSLVGYNNKGQISLCHNNGTVIGNRNVGGLVGRNSGTITLSYSTGPVDGNDIIIGGLVGSNSEGIILSCYNFGETSGYRLVGGLVGTNSLGSILCCFSEGKVSGEYNIGGLVGENGRSEKYHGNITSSFWDTETSGITTSDGGTGKTTAEMQDINTYLNAGWDFTGEQGNGTHNFWSIQDSNYPKLTVFSESPEYELQGSGTIDEPYLIFDANDLGILWHNPAAHYSLEADINLSDITWNQAVVPYFEGSFNGNKHIINSLHIEGHHYLGLFGKLDQNAEISNLALELVDINGIGDYIGALAGENNLCIITSVSCTGKVNGKNYVGGLVGYNISRLGIISSYSTAIVSGEDSIGGLAGANSGSIISCFSNSTVIGKQYIGGLVGANTREIFSCYSTGTTIGGSHVGGLVGKNGRILILNCYSTGLVSGETYLGGMTPYDRIFSYNACFWDIETSGISTSGGGIGKTTAEMKDINTFLNAGWDFIGETDNGTQDIWWIDNGVDYPRLWWELENNN